MSKSSRGRSASKKGQSSDNNQDNTQDSGHAVVQVASTDQSTLPEENRVFVLDPVTVNTLADSKAINTARSYSEKTLGVSFTTGDNVTDRQVIFEQGGKVRGMNMFVENGELHIATWNFAEEKWGYKEITTSITANTSFSATLVLNGTLQATGSLTGYVNGVQVGEVDGVGLLYKHTGDVGIGMMKGASVFDGTGVKGDGYVFLGVVEKLVEYNDVLNHDDFDKLQNYLGHNAGQETPPADDTPPSADPDPVATADTLTVNEDKSKSIDVLANDTGVGIALSAVGAAAHGQTAMGANGSVIYTPDANYYGSDSFTYTIVDQNGKTDTATVAVSVKSVNDIPVLVNAIAAQSMGEGERVEIDLSGVFSDADGDSLSLSVTGPSFVRIENGMTLVIDTADGDDGSHNVTLSAADGNGGSASTSFVLNVADSITPPPVDDTPPVDSTPPVEEDPAVVQAILVSHAAAMALAAGTFVLDFTADMVSGRQGLFSKDATGYGDGGHISAFIEDGHLSVRLQDSSSEVFLESGAIQAGQEYSMALAFGDGTAALYVDGQLVDSISFDYTMTGNTEVLKIGANGWASTPSDPNWTADYFEGRMDGFALYGEKLSAAQIVDMANGVDIGPGHDPVYALDAPTIFDTDGVISGNGAPPADDTPPVDDVPPADDTPPADNNDPATGGTGDPDGSGGGGNLSIAGVTGSFEIGGSITISGLHFGTLGPNVIMYDSFENGVTGSYVQTQGSEYGEWGDAGGEAKYYAQGYSGGMAASVNGDGAVQKGGVQMVAGLDDPNGDFGYAGFSEVFVAVAIKDVSVFPGASSVDTFPDFSATKDLWMMYGPDGHEYGASGQGHDYILGGWNGGGFSAGGNTTPLPTWWMANNWELQEWNHESFYVKLDPNDPYGDVDQAYLQFVNSSGVSLEVRDGALMTEMPGVPAMWDRINFGGWYSWAAENDIRLMDDAYMAIGPGAQARVVITNSADYDTSTLITYLVPTAWDDGSITASFYGSAITDIDHAYLYVFDADGNVNSVGYKLSDVMDAPPADSTPLADNSGENVNYVDPELIQFSDMHYLGSFRIPDGMIGDSQIAFGGTALAYNAANNSLFMVGHVYDQAIAEFKIPDLIVDSNNIDDLTTATVLQSFSGHIFESIPEWGDVNSNSMIGGLMVVDGTLVGTVYEYYDGDYSADVSHFRTDSLDLDTTDVSGMYTVGDAGAGYVAGYMAEVPEEWQDELGASYVTGQAALSIIGRTSIGPSAFGFDPDDLGSGTVDADPYVFYPLGSLPDGQDWDNNDMFLGGTTEITGMVFVPDSRTVLFFGDSAAGDIYYGEAEDANDGSRGYKGYHAVNGEYQYTIWAYDVDDLIAVKNGEMGASDIKPYDIWNYDLPFSDPSMHIGGVAYDSASGYLYVSQLSADHIGYDPNPLISVFDLKPDEILSGTDGDDVLYGRGGNDTLIAGMGSDTLVGGSDADIFRFDSLDGVDTVKDFNVAEGDVLDLSHLLDGYDPLADALSDFVKLTQNGADTVLSVDANGGADGFAMLAILSETQGLELASLVNSGQLVV